MANNYVKQWHYECNVIFETKASSVEELVNMKTPPANANCNVTSDDLRFIKSTVKEVKQVANNVSKVDDGDTGDGKTKKKSIVKDKQG